MLDQKVQRLKQLKSEYKAGQKMLADLHTQEANLLETLQRISAAIRVLEEELAKSSAGEKPMRK